MKVGVQLPEVERDVRWPEYVALARAAEEEGYDSIWIGDHLLYRGDGRPERGPWDCWSLLAALAAVTRRVELGPLVACTAFRDPGLLARAAAAVDEVSGGRLRVAVGAGWNEEEFRAFGVPFDRRISRFEEAFAIVRGLLAGERVTLHGRYHTVEDAVLLPPPARRPPLMVGGEGDRLLAATLPYVDAWNAWFDRFGNRPDGFAALNERIDAACERVARDPATLTRSACLLVQVDGGSGERARNPSAPPLRPDQLADELTSFAAAGVDEAILVLDPITERSIRSLRTAIPSV